MADGQLTRGFQWAAAFVAFCNGAPEDEISQIFEIPLETLRARIFKEQWNKLRAKLPLDVSQGGAPLAAQVNAKLAVIQENRQTNLKIWADLREDVLDVVQKLRTGKLIMEKQFHNKGSVVRCEVPLTIADRVNLATYFRTVSDGTYRALGDVTAAEKAGQDASAGAAAAGQPAITIILPMAIAQPREEREMKSAKSEVIDLRPVMGEPSTQEKK